jgi:small basic protein
VLGGLRARLSDQYDDAIFISGFFANTLLAGGLVLLGEKLGLEAGIGDQRVSAMMIAAVVVFGSRIFNNLAVLRRLIIERWRDAGSGSGTATTVVATSTRTQEGRALEASGTSTADAS